MKILLICYVTPFILKKQAVYPSETLPTFCKTALCYFTEESKGPTNVIQFVTYRVENFATGKLCILRCDDLYPEEGSRKLLHSVGFILDSVISQKIVFFYLISFDMNIKLRNTK